MNSIYTVKIGTEDEFELIRESGGLEIRYSIQIDDYNGKPQIKFKYKRNITRREMEEEPI